MPAPRLTRRGRPKPDCCRFWLIARSASRAGSYLPGSDDPALAAVLRALQMHPGDNRSLAELAESVHTTERTLRRCQRDLGMPLAAWRQRLRVSAPCRT